MDHSQKPMFANVGKTSGTAALADVREEDERLEVSPSKAARAGADGEPRTLTADGLRRQFDESDDEDSGGTLGFSFDPYGANRGTARYREQMEARNQLSGCVFGILGIVILGLSSWLLHRGQDSHRQEEIKSYLEDVRVSTALIRLTNLLVVLAQKWKHFYQKEFEQLELGVSFLNGSFAPMTRNVGEKTAELDMKIALGRASPEEYHQLRKHSHDMTEMDFAANARRGLSDLKLEPIDYDKIQNEQLDIDYTPIKYEVTLTPNQSNLLFPRAVILDTNKVVSSMNLRLNYTGNEQDYIKSQDNITTNSFQLLYKSSSFSKQLSFCEKKKGLSVSGRNCLIFYKISKACILVDRDVMVSENITIQ